MIFQLSNTLVHGIDQNGHPNPTLQNQITTSIQNIEKLCDLLLGSILEVRGKKFILIGLEIYYGSIGDTLQDWYKVNYGGNAHGVAHANVVHQEGPALQVYFNQNNFGPRTRIDIVVGPQEVAASILIRDIQPHGANAPISGPNRCFTALGVQNNDLKKPIVLTPNTGDYVIHPNYGDKKIKYMPRKGYTAKSPAIQQTMIDSIYGLKWYRKLKTK